MKILHADYVNIEYLFYYMQTIKYNYTTHKRYWISDYSKIKTPLPPLAEQDRIVTAIESAFAVIDKIEKNKSELQTLVAAAKAKILSLAIRGKLVPQNPVDEPASVLLERIRDEKETLIKTGKIKRDKSNSSISRSDDNCYYEKINGKSTIINEVIPFELPKGWEWTRLKNMSKIVMGQSPPSDYVSENASGLEFHQGKIYFTNKFLSSSGQFTKEANKIASKNSVLLCVRAPVGILNITNRKIAIGRGLCSISPLANMSVDFLFYWLTAFQGYFMEQATGTTFIAITIDVVNQLLVPIPPFQEQEKIVKTFKSSFEYLDIIINKCK
jgi:type I restriction enzyme S subunit